MVDVDIPYSSLRFINEWLSWLYINYLFFEIFFEMLYQLYPIHPQADKEKPT